VRKLVLIAAFALASVSAQAAERIDRVPAENDAPVAAAAPAPATPVATPSAVVEPQTPRKPASSNQTYSKQTYSKQAASTQAYRSRTSLRETHERQARRIAAAYGISW
jgi:hypothetical protein